MSVGDGVAVTAAAGPAQHRSLQSLRESRWIGQEYADITKLRELAAKHDRASARFQARAARLHTRIEKLRHVATVLREKGQRALGEIPEIEQEMAQHERDIKTASERTGGVVVGSDVTGLHYRIRKLQQKIVDLQHKARTLEHRAAVKTQKTAELKIKADQMLEKSRLEQLEAESYRQRADRLQMATEAEVQARLTAPPSATASDGSPPGERSLSHRA
jgi:peptidoglycan hydrolase CwlO-like protein